MSRDNTTEKLRGMLLELQLPANLMLSDEEIAGVRELKCYQSGYYDGYMAKQTHEVDV